MVRLLSKPISWAIIYLSLIPIFAVLYTLIPHGFYHSTIKLENSFANYQAEISRLIESNVSASAKAQFPNAKLAPIDPDWSVNIENIHVGNIGFPEGLLFSFTLQTDFEKLQDVQAGGPTIAGGVVVDVRVGKQVQHIAIDDKVTYLLPLEVSSPFEGISPEFTPQNIRKIFSFSGTKFLQNTLYLRLDPEEFGKIETLLESNEGLPSSLPDSFFRMLYFSTVTITTLGYGDIVPIDNWSRLLILLESILGIVIAGVFVSKCLERRGVGS